MKREQDEADLILAQWKEEELREKEKVRVAEQAEKEAARIERGRQTILERREQQELEEKRRKQLDQELALVARMVAEETVSRAASQLSFALHREENSSGTEERREEKSEGILVK